MRNEHIKDYLWSEMVPSIDNKTLMHNCLLIEKFLEKNIVTDKKSWCNKLVKYTSFTGREFGKYNIFTFPSIELVKLFNEMKKLITPILNLKESYMIQSWLNVYRENGFIDWHGHWPAEDRAIHGVYCVNVEDNPSYTEYKFPLLNDSITTVHSKDGLLLFGKSEDDKHRSSQGWNSSNPRITIAFDIIPVSVLQAKYDFFENYLYNHYLPF